MIHNRDDRIETHNIILLRGAALWILVALASGMVSGGAQNGSAADSGDFSREIFSRPAGPYRLPADERAAARLLRNAHSVRLARALGDGRGRIHQLEPVPLAGGVSGARRPAREGWGPTFSGSISWRASSMTTLGFAGACLRAARKFPAEAIEPIGRARPGSAIPAKS